MGILADIEAGQAAGRKRFVLLLDPEKAHPERLTLRGAYLPDFLFVGGSTGGGTEAFVQHLRTLTDLPIVLFPGRVEQFTPTADALLFLSVLSGRNAEMLIGQQIRAARRVAQSDIESIPMGYILVDGGVETAVMRATQTQPLSQERVNDIVDTAIAAELLGKRLVYLEAGSGAQHAVNETIIHAVREVVHIPLIVGGGIRTTEQMTAAFNAGADIVVIGNHFESHPEALCDFARCTKVAYRHGPFHSPYTMHNV